MDSGPTPDGATPAPGRWPRAAFLSALLCTAAAGFLVPVLLIVLLPSVLRGKNLSAFNLYVGLGFLASVGSGLALFFSFRRFTGQPADFSAATVTKFFDAAKGGPRRWSLVFAMAGLAFLLSRATSHAVNPGDLVNPRATVGRMHDPRDPLSIHLRDSLSPKTVLLLNAHTPPQEPSEDLVKYLCGDLNHAISGGPLYTPARFAGVGISRRTSDFLAAARSENAIKRLNRMLLEDAFPREIRRSPGYKVFLWTTPWAIPGLLGFAFLALFLGAAVWYAGRLARPRVPPEEAEEKTMGDG